jgi:hypothetical protein
VAEIAAEGAGQKNAGAVSIAVSANNNRSDTSEATVEETGVAVTSELMTSESINVWPDETAEAAFLAETRGNGVPLSAAPEPAAAEKEDVTKVLPGLDELVKRIPEETRELLDELFRAKFTTVRRVKKTDLKA